MEKSSLIRHTSSKSNKKPDSIQPSQSNELRSANAIDSQALLKDVNITIFIQTVPIVLHSFDTQAVNQVLEGEGVGWLKVNRIRKLMEDENYRNLVVSRLNKTLEQKIGPDEHIDDVVIINNN